MQKKSKVIVLFVGVLLVGVVLYLFGAGNGNKFSPGSNVCEGISSTDELPRYGRLMHDPQWMAWPSRLHDPDWANGFHFDRYPETVQLTTKPKSGDGRLPYSREWLDYLRDLQEDDEAAVWIARIAAGLFNRGNADIPILNLDQMSEVPVAESISSGGNVVKIVELKNGSVRIDMLYFKDTPPSTDEVNYQKTPWLVTKFTSVAYDGELGLAGGIDVYFPNLAKKESGYWVVLERVELFPALPACATVQRGTSVRTNPAKNTLIIGRLIKGQRVTIYEYLPQGSDVWGRTDAGWIRLEYQNIWGQPVYTTSWAMDTRPPMVFP